MTRRTNPKRSNRREGSAGFTLIEILVVLAIIGIIATAAIPAYMDMLWKARAAAIVNDFVVLREAVLEHHIEHDAFPRDRRRGRQPPELDASLGTRVNWANTRLGYEYDWDNWTRPDGTARRPNSGVRIGFTVFSRKPALRRHIIDSYDGPLRIRGRRVTFIIEPV